MSEDYRGNVTPLTSARQHRLAGAIEALLAEHWTRGITIPRLLVIVREVVPGASEVEVFETMAAIARSREQARANLEV